MIPVFNTLNRLNKLNITGKLHPTPVMWHNYSDTTLTATPASDTAMDLAWTNPVIAGVTLKNVVVEISTDGVAFTEAATLGVVTSNQVTGLTTGSPYYFRLAFVNSRGVRTGNGGIVSATTFVAAAQAYFAAMTVQLTTPQKQVINTAMVATSAQLAKLDCVMLALSNEQQSLLWINDPTKTGTKVNSPTFTAYKGWSGSSTNYINTGFNPGGGSTYKLKLNDALVGVYKNDLNGSSNRLLFGTTGLSVGVYQDNQRVLAYINDTTSYVQSYNVNIKEFLIGKRIESLQRISQFNKQYKVDTPDSDAIPNDYLKYAYSGDRCCFWFVGAYLTDQETFDLQDAWLPVFEHLGSDYWSNFTPTTLTAMAGAGKIDLAWTLPVTTYSPYTVTNVVIQESTDNVTFTDITTLGAVTSHSVTVPTGQTRYYKIRYVSSRNILTLNSAEAHATAI